MRDSTFHSDGVDVDDQRAVYETSLGAIYQTTVEEALENPDFSALHGSVQLIFTSPPFPLNRKKKYGNLRGAEYVAWLSSLAPRLADLLTPDGSIVIEIGNAWEPGSPSMSILTLQSLLAFLEAGDLELCQQFVCNNPARLPSPAQWVTIERIRVKDSFTNVWWMANSDRPKANNRNVLSEYSPAMLKLLSSKKYNTGDRPSGHDIGSTSFLKNNGGSIPSNVLSFSNTSSSDPYLRFCREQSLDPHPARMPAGLAEFFIKFLTDPGDLVLDPFAGSNLTGAVSESLERKWISFEPLADYIAGSRGRFPALLA